MKQVNFRIIELPTHQVLLNKDFDDNEENSPLLIFTFFLEDVKICQKFGYSDESKRDKVFIDFTDVMAQNMLNNALALFND